MEADRTAALSSTGAGESIENVELSMVAFALSRDKSMFVKAECWMEREEWRKRKREEATLVGSETDASLNRRAS